MISTILVLSPWLHAIPIRVLAWDDVVAARKLAISDSKGLVIIGDMHPSKRTKAYHVAAEEKPTFILALDKNDSDGKPAASAIIIPQGTKQPLLLVLPDAKAASGIRLLVLEDAVANFPWGAFRFINACGKPLAFSYDKKVVVLPVSWNPVVVNPGGGNRNLETQMFCMDQPKRPIYSAVWEQQQDVRTLIFVVPGEDPRLGPVAMKMISEDRRVLAAKQTAVNSPRSNQ